MEELNAAHMKAVWLNKLLFNKLSEVIPSDCRAAHFDFRALCIRGRRDRPWRKRAVQRDRMSGRDLGSDGAELHRHGALSAAPQAEAAGNGRTQAERAEKVGAIGKVARCATE